MYFLRLLGWGLLTIGVMGLVLPFLPSARGDADNISVMSVSMSIGMLLVGGLLLAKTREAD